MKTFIFFILLPLTSIASVTVAFLEITTSEGQILQLEPGGRFAHSAISYHNLWLHVHPYRGVELISREELEKIGKVTSLLELPDASEPSEYFVREVLGRPYDRTFSWNSANFYCAKLIGQILGISPEPMLFAASIWPLAFQTRRGDLGLSPDDLFRILVTRGVLTKAAPRTCSKAHSEY
jgi:hypothetical protein